MQPGGEIAVGDLAVLGAYDVGGEEAVAVARGPEGGARLGDPGVFHQYAVDLLQ